MQAPASPLSWLAQHALDSPRPSFLGLLPSPLLPVSSLCQPCPSTLSREAGWHIHSHRHKTVLMDRGAEVTCPNPPTGVLAKGLELASAVSSLPPPFLCPWLGVSVQSLGFLGPVTLQLVLRVAYYHTRSKVESIPGLVT
jgi:hypothetical protein